MAHYEVLDSTTLDQYAKATVKVGDWIIVTDSNSEHRGRVGMVTKIKRYHPDSGPGVTGTSVWARFYGTAINGDPPGEWSFGRRWIEFFGPAECEGYEWLPGGWRTLTRNREVCEIVPRPLCFKCTAVATRIRAAGSGSMFACVDHAQPSPGPAEVAITVKCYGPPEGINWFVKGGRFERGPFSQAEALGEVIRLQLEALGEIR